MGSFCVSFLDWFVSCLFSPFFSRKCNCAFVFQRNLRASKWEEPQKQLAGLHLHFAEPRGEMSVWLGSVLSIISGWYPGLVAALWLSLLTEPADQLRSQQPSSAAWGCTGVGSKWSSAAKRGACFFNVFFWCLLMLAAASSGGCGFQSPFSFSGYVGLSQSSFPSEAELICKL